MLATKANENVMCASPAVRVKGVNKAKSIPYAIQMRSSLFSEEWRKQRSLPPAHSSTALPEPRRSHAVASRWITLLSTAWLRRGYGVPREGPVQGWKTVVAPEHLFGAR